MRRLVASMFVVPLLVAVAVAAGPEPGAVLPSTEAALALAQEWRVATLAEQCERGKDFVLRCAGPRLPRAMPAPVWFGIEVNDKDHVGGECEKWGAGHRLAKVESEADYALLRACLAIKMDARKSDPMQLVSLAQVAKRLPKPARRQLRALEKTHRFVAISHRPTSPDPDRFDLVLAITGDTDGKARLGALFMAIVVSLPDGE
jgi:hypothetical protein